MIRHQAQERAFAAFLAALAGYVDALGFIQLDGYFVAFMSGNSTQLGVGLIGETGHAARAALLIAAFVAGVVGSTFLRAFVATGQRRFVVGLVALSIAAAAALAPIGVVPSLAVAAFGMGALNGTFQRDGEVSIGLTYMTGTLVKLGQHLAAAILGRGGAWGSHLMLWAALIAGAILGGLSSRYLGLQGLWIPAALFAIAALVAPHEG